MIYLQKTFELKYFIYLFLPFLAILFLNFSSLEILNIFSDKSIINVIKNAEEKIRLYLIQLLKESNKIFNTTLFINEAISKLKITNSEDINFEAKDGTDSEIFKIIKVINEEKRRLGSPAANLLAENILFRIEQNNL